MSTDPTLSPKMLNPFVAICALCEEQEANEQLCSCEHRFCSECLQTFSYKINLMEKLVCPSEGSPEPIDKNGDFFQSLPPELLKKNRRT